MMQLDAAGRVVRYTPADERPPSAPAPTEVLGRNFFDDVAPVSEVAEVKSRFLAFMAFGDAVQRLTLKFPHDGLTIKVQIVMESPSARGVAGGDRTALVRVMPDDFR